MFLCDSVPSDSIAL